ncbi:MAG: sugar transporter, partial [Planktotalea sp.]
LIGERRQARQAALSELQTAVSLRRAELDEARNNYLSQLDLGTDNNDYVYLTGEVEQQSRFALPIGRRANLADAMFDTAGGISGPTGDVSQIYVLRASSDPREFGAITAWHLDAQNAANFALSTRFELRPNDVVFVAQQPITKWNRAIDQILPTLLNVSSSALN